MTRRIKVIKQSGSPATETVKSPEDAPKKRRRIERNLQEAVDSWIEERRKNAEIEGDIARGLLRESLA